MHDQCAGGPFSAGRGTRTEGTMKHDWNEQLEKYLTDAHSIEEQSLQQLEAAPDIAGETGLAQALRDHLEVTKEHERRVRHLLEQRDAEPSAAKDAIMKAGGAGFILFARVQPDTPGKLAAHALSYEALEWASYDLLARTAERAGAADVASVARTIRDEEKAMMDRIEGLFDATVEASLDGATDDDLPDRLRTYLADAHAIEAQSIKLLESARSPLEEYPALAQLVEDHLAESLGHRQLLEERLDAVGGQRSVMKDTALKGAALNWSAFFRAHPDTAGKLAAFSYAFEFLEIGGYEQLRRVATRAGDVGTVQVVNRILDEERRAAMKISAAFDAAVDAALVEQGLR